ARYAEEPALRGPRLSWGERYLRALVTLLDVRRVLPMVCQAGLRAAIWQRLPRNCREAKNRSEKACGQRMAAVERKDNGAAGSDRAARPHRGVIMVASIIASAIIITLLGQK